MSSSDQELEGQLKEVGNRLLNTPPATDALLKLLDASQMTDLGEPLVGSRIRVWWPMDKAFYEGVVSSYDPAKKKHLVLYVDGDEENLNLKKQCWQLRDDVLPNVSPMHDLGERLVGSRIRVWWPMDKAFYEGVVSSYDPAKKKHLFEQVQMENLPKPESSSDKPQKRKRKTKSEICKQEKAGLSSKRHGVSAGIFIVEYMKSGSKSADCSTLGELKVINGEEDDQSEENDRLKDDG